MSNRSFPCFVFLILVVTLLGSNSKAQASDPIRIAVQEPGKFSVNLGLAFIPFGDRFIASDNSLGTQQNYAINFGVSVSYVLDGQASVSGTIIGAFQLTRTIAAGQDVISTLINATGNVNFLYHLELNGLYDPTLSFSLGFPWILGTRLSARFIRDPIVIRGSLGISKPLISQGLLLVAGTSIIFIANERITLSSQVSTEIPIGTLTLPTSSLTFRVGYTLNSDTLEEWGLSITLFIGGNITRIGFSFDWNR